MLYLSVYNIFLDHVLTVIRVYQATFKLYAKMFLDISGYCVSTKFTEISSTQYYKVLFKSFILLHASIAKLTDKISLH